MPNLVLCSKEDADDYLMHYRTKGSKNGIRRWQNEDGSLTPAGEEHYREMYGHAKRKLKKLKNETNVQLQEQVATEHEEKASVARSRAKAAALGAVGVATGGALGPIRNLHNQRTSNFLERASTSGMDKLFESRAHILDEKINKTVRGTAIAAGGLAAGSAAALGYSAYHSAKAKAARFRMTEEGHRKAVEKYNSEYNKYVEQFKDTPYEVILKGRKYKVQ